MATMCSLIMFIGRICMSAIFIAAGIGKFMEYDATYQYMASKNLPMVPLLLIGAALVEIFGGLSLILGYKIRWGAFILILFVGAASYIFHDFWNITDEADQKLQMIMFMKNLAIVGGLLQVAACGAGRCSFDECCRGKYPIEKK